MTPQTAAPAPTTLVVAHPTTLSGAEILDIVNSAVDQDAPLVVQAIPSASPRISVYVTLGEIGLGIINQIAQMIHGAHQAKATS
jgi:hypothetical protein